MKNPDQWYTSKEISEKLSVSIGSVTMSLKKLRKTNIIKYRNTGKRNTFQYMVQSEPAKLLERKSPLIEQLGGSQQPEAAKVRVKIKPKIVHQHTYLSGQTFYGVIRPKEEVDAMERQRVEQQAVIASKIASAKNLKPSSEKQMRKAPLRKVVKRAKPRKTLKTRSSSKVASRTSRTSARATPKRKVQKLSSSRAKAKTSARSSLKSTKSSNVKAKAKATKKTRR